MEATLKMRNKKILQIILLLGLLVSLTSLIHAEDNASSGGSATENPVEEEPVLEELPAGLEGPEEIPVVEETPAIIETPKTTTSENTTTVTTTIESTEDTENTVSETSANPEGNSQSSGSSEHSGSSLPTTTEQTDVSPDRQNTDENTATAKIKETVSKYKILIYSVMSILMILAAIIIIKTLKKPKSN
jgi:cobalamin biosynthesis Mg chelatase CobN